MPWTINSEIYPSWARSTGNAAATFTNWVVNLAMSMSFLSLTQALTRFGMCLIRIHKLTLVECLEVKRPFSVICVKLIDNYEQKKNE